MMVFVPEMPAQLNGVPGCFNDFEVLFLHSISYRDTWMSRWKLGSMTSKWVRSPTYDGVYIGPCPHPVTVAKTSE